MAGMPCATNLGIADEFLDQLTKRYWKVIAASSSSSPVNHDVCWYTSFAALERVPESEWRRESFASH